jgi:hypothetical protein
LISNDFTFGSGLTRGSSPVGSTPTGLTSC